MRGVTGLSDAARWVATLRKDGGEIIFAVIKSNVSILPESLRLRWHDGILTAVSASERQATEDQVEAARQEMHQAALDDAVRRVVAALRREGVLSSRDSIVRAAGLGVTNGRPAVDLAIARGLIRRTGTSRAPEFTIGDPPGDPRCVCERPPIPPVGRRTSDVEGCDSVPDDNYTPPTEPF